MRRYESPLKNFKSNIFGYVYSISTDELQKIYFFSVFTSFLLMNSEGIMPMIQTTPIPWSFINF